MTRRLICLLFGHRWYLLGRSPWHGYSRRCERCGHEVER